MTRTLFRGKSSISRSDEGFALLRTAVVIFIVSLLVLCADSWLFSSLRSLEREEKNLENRIEQGKTEAFTQYESF